MQNAISSAWDITLLLDVLSIDDEDSVCVGKDRYELNFKLDGVHVELSLDTGEKQGFALKLLHDGWALEGGGVTLPEIDGNEITFELFDGEVFGARLVAFYLHDGSSVTLTVEPDSVELV